VRCHIASLGPNVALSLSLSSDCDADDRRGAEPGAEDRFGFLSRTPRSLRRWRCANCSYYQLASSVTTSGGRSPPEPPCSTSGQIGLTSLYDLTARWAFRKVVLNLLLRSAPRRRGRASLPLTAGRDIRAARSGTGRRAPVIIESMPATPSRQRTSNGALSLVSSDMSVGVGRRRELRCVYRDPAYFQLAPRRSSVRGTSIQEVLVAGNVKKDLPLTPHVRSAQPVRRATQRCRSDG
jgi:hypothetical protein